MFEAGKSQYIQSSEGQNMSVKTELQIVKGFRFVLRLIESGFKVFFGFIKTMIAEVLHPGSGMR